jgi:hypothetical protein
VDEPGVIVFDPDPDTDPIPSIATSVALSVFHVSVAVWPCSITVGFAASVAVGAAGGGAAGGVAFAAFLLQAANDNTPTRVPANAIVFHVDFVIESSSLTRVQPEMAERLCATIASEHGRRCVQSQIRLATRVKRFGSDYKGRKSAAQNGAEFSGPTS